jgi:hypothetical protein
VPCGVAAWRAGDDTDASRHGRSPEGQTFATRARFAVEGRERESPAS